MSLKSELEDRMEALVLNGSGTAADGMAEAVAVVAERMEELFGDPPAQDTGRRARPDVPCNGCRHCTELRWTGEAQCNVMGGRVSVTSCQYRREADA